MYLRLQNSHSQEWLCYEDWLRFDSFDSLKKLSYLVEGATTTDIFRIIPSGLLNT